MSNRFFCDTPITSETAQLGEIESRHLSKVMRKNVGDQIVLFDGSGCEFNATISAIAKKSVSLEIVDRIEISRELDFDITIAAPLPKGDRQTWMVAKLVELGVRRFVPLITQRSVAKPTESALTRLRKCVIESSKQCERNLLMEISMPLSYRSYVESDSSVAARFVAEPSANASLPTTIKQGVAVLFGPEGGLSAEEVEFAINAGWNQISLGKRILRLETAAVAAAAWLSLSRL